VTNASSYIWSISGSANPSLTIASGQGTTCVVVNVPAGYTGGQKVKVAATNCKGTSDYRTKDIKRLYTPAQPGSISGASSVCKSNTKNYSVGGVAGATSYNWTVTGGATIASGQGTTNVSINFNTAVSTSAVISVTASNACGTSIARTKTVPVNLTCKVADNASNTAFIAESLTAYPNPTSGKATISFTSNVSAKYSLKVTDVIGRIMISDNISAAEGYNTKEINLENVAKGLYFITLQTEGSESQTLRLVVE
jgi:hypothetical protein